MRYVKHKQTESRNVFKLPTTVSALSSKELKEVNSQVSEVAQSKSSSSACIPRDHVNYNKYTPEQRAMIGRYAAENGPTCAANHFTTMLKMKVPEPTARRLKKEYLAKLSVVYNQKHKHHRRRRQVTTQKVMFK